MRNPGIVVPLVACLLAPASALAQHDVSAGGRVETDLYESKDSPPGALLDGDTKTHFAQHRLEDADWRIWLARPAVVQSLRVVQGWSDWSQALQVRLETADGSTATLDLKPGTRDAQTIALALPKPTAFVDVYVVKASPAKDGQGWGGFAEMRFDGTPSGDDTTPPAVSQIAVQRDSDTSATVAWTTDEPATSQVRYSTEGVASQLTQPDAALVTAHSVKIVAAEPLRGQVEIRSADAAGNRAEVRHDAFVTIDTAYQYGIGGWSFELGGKWIPASQVLAQDGLGVRFVQQWIGGDGWTKWLTPKSVKELSDAGYTPEVIHYYFGDPVLSDVQGRRDAFLADIKTLASVLEASGVGDRTLVTLEPEYNQGEVATWDGWNDLMIEAIRILRAQAKAKVGLLPGDWDIDHVVPISMGRAAALADFVAFQEMRASTKDTPEEARQVVGRAIRFSHYLSRKFLRPVRWGYAMVSDYGGWTWVQRDVVVEMCERRSELERAGVVAP
jgi:hypothetical protein